MSTLSQFCINLCNEQLQSQFIDVIFGVEQQIYKAFVPTRADHHIVPIRVLTGTDTLIV